MNKKTAKKGILSYTFLILFILVIFYLVNVMNQKIEYITYDEFIENIESNNIEEIEVTPKNRANVYEITGKMKNSKDDESFFVRIPLSDVVIDRVMQLGEAGSFKLDVNTDPESSTLLLFIINVLPMVILIGFAFFFITRQMGSANKEYC